MQINRVIIHVDFDYFYAQCEARENPSLKDKPVVVCVYSGRGEDSGAVATANYVARKYGVRSGIPIVQAKRKLRDVDAAFLPVNFELYDKVSENIMNILRGYAERFEQMGIDEAFLDVTTKIGGDFAKATQLSLEIQNEIITKERITVSIGVGPNKLVAKIAAGRQKPFGLTVVRPEEVEAFLGPLPVNELLGVGRKTTVAMEEMGVKTISDLVKFDLDKLVRRFGKVMGVYFYNAARGIDASPVQERGMAESISHIPTLKEDTKDLHTILVEAYQICADVYERAGMLKLSFKTVTVQLILQDMSTTSRSRTLETPVENLETLKAAVKELFQKLLADVPAELKARRIGVKISNFSTAMQSQKHLTEFAAK